METMQRFISPHAVDLLPMNAIDDICKFSVQSSINEGSPYNKCPQNIPTLNLSEKFVFQNEEDKTKPNVIVFVEWERNQTKPICVFLMLDHEEEDFKAAKMPQN